ncbi:hypothetical protein EV401DRAFT_1572688 [Pisolithus croceorrhizus]|nr:hypothetical protein EV401DRAFT_1572688 [Pisolithus croceorrhizus]
MWFRGSLGSGVRSENLVSRKSGLRATTMDEIFQANYRKGSEGMEQKGLTDHALKLACTCLRHLTSHRVDVQKHREPRRRRRTLASVCETHTILTALALFYAEETYTFAAERRTSQYVEQIFIHITAVCENVEKSKIFGARESCSEKSRRYASGTRGSGSVEEMLQAVVASPEIMQELADAIKIPRGTVTKFSPGDP